MYYKINKKKRKERDKIVCKEELRLTELFFLMLCFVLLFRAWFWISMEIWVSQNKWKEPVESEGVKIPEKKVKHDWGFQIGMKKENSV